MSDVLDDRKPLSRDHATVMVGKHLLVVLEDIIKAHEAVVLDEKKTDIQKADARLVIAAAQGFGRPLFTVIKAAERPRILRPERAIRIVR
jgi:hypothetical protein